MNRIEEIILNQLIEYEEYSKKTLPFIKDTYFTEYNEKVLFKLIRQYSVEYHAIPTFSTLKIMLGKVETLNGDQYTSCAAYLEKLSSEVFDRPFELQWLVDETEKFCQEHAVLNALMESVEIVQGKDEKQDKGAIPKILSDALAVSFDNKIGHDYFEDADARFDYYNRKESRLPFSIEYMNKITDGGLVPKTLNILMAGTNVGKTLAMGNFAADHVIAGKNVLYISMEMQDVSIAERVDANLFDLAISDVKGLAKQFFDQKINSIKKKTCGRLIIRDFPTAGANAGHFRYLINELKLKKKFTPDIIYVDYLNICASSRVKLGNSVNSYLYVKAISEELRGLAGEFNVPIVTAVQTNRDQFSSSDGDLTGIAEGFSIAMTADLVVLIMTNEELEKQSQFMFKQLKNRYSDVTKNKKFVVGVDRSKMKLYNVSNFDLETMTDESAVKDEMKDRDYNENWNNDSKKSKRDFSEFKI